MAKIITKRLIVRVLVVAIIVLCGVLVSQRRRYTAMFEVQQRNPPERFIRAVRERSDAAGSVILALVDSGFVDMAVNFYRTSLRPHGIHNFLFVSVSRRACDVLDELSLPCYNYTEDEHGDGDSSFGSPEFVRKLNIRTEIILDALSANATIVVSDLDVVFKKNPLPELNNQPEALVALWDSDTYNAGFIRIRPTEMTKAVYSATQSMTAHDAGLNDQVALNIAIRSCNTYFPGWCDVGKLDTDRYLCGRCYFEEGGRMFPDQNPCDECVVVHNNWIVSKAAKVYRFKEHHMWLDDVDGYYTSRTAHYVTYGYHGDVTYEEQTWTLQTALAVAHILNRILILPRFPCDQCTDCVPQPTQCPLNTWYNVSTFDEHFKDVYRESTFLEHHLVPKEIKESVSKTFNIEKITTPRDLKVNFGRRLDKVLVFDFGSGTTLDLAHDEWFTDMIHKLDIGIQRSNYRQLLV